MNKLHKDHFKEASAHNINPPFDLQGMLNPLVNVKEKDSPSDISKTTPLNTNNNNAGNNAPFSTEANNKEELQLAINSPMSLKENSNVIIITDQIFALIIRLYTEIKIETEENFQKKKDSMICSLLNAVKILSLCRDNHKTIFEIVYNF